MYCDVLLCTVVHCVIQCTLLLHKTVCYAVTVCSVRCGVEAAQSNRGLPCCTELFSSSLFLAWIRRNARHLVNTCGMQARCSLVLFLHHAYPCQHQDQRNTAHSTCVL